MLKEELSQVHEILAIWCLGLPASDYESVKINKLCHKMTIHRINILYTIFENGKRYMDYCRVSMTYSHRCTEKPDLVDEKEPLT